MNRTLVRGRLFSRLVIDDTGCLLWTGYKDTCGYGRVKINQRAHSVHRLMYELFVGEIPDGMEIDHLCRVRHCASPAHLEVVTHAENLRRAEMPDRKGVATHCKAGHEFDLLNTYYRTNGNRRCRTCDRERDRPSRRRAASGDGQPLTVAAVTPELAERMGEIADAAQEVPPCPAP